MTEQELAAIQQRLHGLDEGREYDACTLGAWYFTDVPALLAEIKRLQAAAKCVCKGWDRWLEDEISTETMSWAIDGLKQAVGVEVAQ